jgi:hypothetical protein
MERAAPRVVAVHLAVLAAVVAVVVFMAVAAVERDPQVCSLVLEVTPTLMVASQLAQATHIVLEATAAGEAETDSVVLAAEEDIVVEAVVEVVAVPEIQVVVEAVGAPTFRLWLHCCAAIVE